ncbi:putative purine nucleoside phosphorylase [Termitomyces sp. T112]|nr:putative purine nucleoside phosphorylase [Termitomyces sp. T112]
MIPSTLIFRHIHEKTSPPVVETLQAIKSFLPSRLQKPHVGIVCGSGLSDLVDSFREVVLVPYDQLPGFTKSTVPGHKSVLAFGLLGPGDGVPAVAMLGRFHPYEGHSLPTVVYPIRVMAKLGVKNLIITNASGSLNSKIPVGTIVVIQDHLALPNLTGMNPLLGPQTSPNHPRFLPLSNAYSPSLRRLAFLSAHKLSLERNTLAEGIYAWVGGPTYETPAEGKLLRLAGADVVGMSTVPEVVVAREEGLNVVVLSLVTNFVVIPDTYRSIKDEVEAELSGKPVELPQIPTVSHEEVLAVGKEKAEVMKKLVEGIVAMIPTVPDLQ